MSLEYKGKVDIQNTEPVQHPYYMSSRIFLGETGDIGRTSIIRLKDPVSAKQNQLAEKGRPGHTVLKFQEILKTSKGKSEFLQR